MLTDITALVAALSGLAAAVAGIVLALRRLAPLGESHPNVNGAPDGAYPAGPAAEPNPGSLPSNNTLVSTTSVKHPW